MRLRIPGRSVSCFLSSAPTMPLPAAMSRMLKGVTSFSGTAAEVRYCFRNSASFRGESHASRSWIMYLFRLLAQRCQNEHGADILVEAWLSVHRIVILNANLSLLLSYMYFCVFLILLQRV